MELLFHGPTALLLEQILQNIFAYLTIFVLLCPLYFYLYVFKQLSKGCQIYFGVGFGGCQTSFLSIFGKTSIIVQKLQRNQNCTNPLIILLMGVSKNDTWDGGQLGVHPDLPLNFTSPAKNLHCYAFIEWLSLQSNIVFFVDLELFHGLFFDTIDDAEIVSSVGRGAFLGVQCRYNRLISSVGKKTIELFYIKAEKELEGHLLGEQRLQRSPGK